MDDHPPHEPTCFQATKTLALLREVGQLVVRAYVAAVRPGLLLLPFAPRKGVHESKKFSTRS